MGKKIENYCLEQVIGEGEFGKVYRATNEKSEQTVAIKVIRIEKYKMSPRLEEFTINEIQTLSKIEDTTHIVRFIEILKTANNVYFVYEFCNGGTLEHLIKSSRHLPQEKAVGYFNDLLKAFRMLVKNKIMHRDIKPSNILLHNGVLKLADFGFCKPLKDARDLSQTMLGSPIYMAPEILKGELYTITADIWSLGVVLYEMVFGFCPFEERNIARLIDLIDSNTAITFPANIRVSKKVEELIKRMLVKDHFKRISWEELFDYDLKEDSEAPEKERTRSPFTKKQFNSVKGIEGHQLVQNLKNYSTKNYSEDTNRPHLFKKPDSKPAPVPDSKPAPVPDSKPAPVPDSKPALVPESKPAAVPTPKQGAESCSEREGSLLRPIVEKRNWIKCGIEMVQEFLKRNNSKLTVNICCFLMSKVKDRANEMEKLVRALQSDKENYSCNYEARKVLASLLDEKDKIQEKVHPFEEELRLIKEPQDILYMRYAEEEGLTQEKDGLIQLLEIDDYLQSSEERPMYMRMTKKELVEEYERRIIRNQ